MNKSPIELNEIIKYMRQTIQEIIQENNDLRDRNHNLQLAVNRLEEINMRYEARI